MPDRFLKQYSQTIARDSQARLLTDTLARRRLLGRRARMRSDGHPQLAIIPEDEIGIEILQFGIHERRILSLLFDDVFTSFLDRFSASTVLDISANIGNRTLYFSKRFHRVLAFEHGFVASSLLRVNFRLNQADNVEPLVMGLSSKDAQASLAPTETNNLGSNSITSDSGADGIEEIELRCGDTVLTEHGDLGKISLVKIDVEGHEIEVLRGLTETLREQKPIILFETAGKYGEGGSDEILTLLCSLGYRHFYTLAKDLPCPRWCSLVARAVVGGLFGSRYVLQQWEALVDRFYSLVIATSDEQIV